MGAVNGKPKGNAYERKIAKDLSIWMFNDPTILRRKADSGSTKINYSGDIFPEGNLPENWNNIFPFMIETKTGYKQNYPNFWSYNTVKKWMEKAREEGKINNQNIVLLICQFKNKKAFFITNEILNLNIIFFNVCFPYQTKNHIEWGYVYFLNDILSLKFEDVFKNQKNL